jgi:small subunit ribosomal protein S13e
MTLSEESNKATDFCSQAVAVRKHLERNRKDKDSKFRLILIESRIHRLSRYYKTVGVLQPNWKYESATASTMVA